jgi:hypothetical protein
MQSALTAMAIETVFPEVWMGNKNWERKEVLLWTNK